MSEALTLVLLGGGNFAVPLPGQSSKEDASTANIDNDIMRQIADAENSSAWTLMHRFNKAADLLNGALQVLTWCPLLIHQTP